MGINKKPEPVYLDENIKFACEETTTFLNNKQYKSGIRRFKEHYATMTTSEISWIQVCEDGRNYDCQKFAFLFIVSLLKKGLYHNDHEKELYSILPDFQRIINSERMFNVGFLLCGKKITDLVIYKHSYLHGGSIYGYVYLKCKNPYIRSELLDFINEPRKSTRWHVRHILNIFEESLGCYADQIFTYKDFDEHTFFEQISFFKKYRDADARTYDYGIKAVCCFYRWLVSKYDTYDFFADAFSLNKYLLFNVGLVDLIKADAYFTTYNPHTEYPDRTKYCFLVRGMDELSTQLAGEDYFSLDLSNLTSSYYRKAVIKYLQASTSVTTITWCGFTNYMTDGLKFITELKSQKNYPNPSLKYLNNQEAVLIRNYYHDEGLQISTLNNKIGALRRFLQWCQEAEMIAFDDMFFDYLKQYEEPAQTTGSAVPDDILAVINSYIVNDIKDNSDALLAYAMFHLSIQTEFRISQICHLKTDCIRPSVKPGQFIVYSGFKTSHGRKNSFVITELTYHVLMNVIEATESIRDACTIESLKDYIFLRPTMNGGYGIFKAAQFNNYMKKVCDDLGLDRTYSAANFRDTHMTKAFEHILRSGKSDLEMGVLSKHKHLDTTKNHYIEIELEKMLEATYGITIGTELIDTDSKIVDELPETAKGKDADVENGCGKCTAKSCVSTTSLPCLSCKHFVTTPQHEVFFKKAIDSLDQLIVQTTNAHDKEDLITVKQLHVLYLKAIYRHKEGLK